MAARAAAAIVAGLALAALASCARSPDDPDSLPRPDNLPATTPAVPSTYPTTAQPDPIPTPPISTVPPTLRSTPASEPATPTNPPPPGLSTRPPTGDQLSAALLTSADLPGYSPTNQSDLDGSTTCADLDVDYTAGASVSVTILLGKASTGPLVRETLLEVPATRMDTILQDFADAPACGTFSGTIAGLGAATYTASRANVGLYGDTTVAVQITAKLDKYPATVVETLVAVRYGSVLMVLTHTAVTGYDDGASAAATARAYAKLQQSPS